MTIPQFQAMPSADRSRKLNLINYWFRLPSALDHRPLFWEELEQILWIKNNENKLQQIYEDIIKTELNLLDENLKKEYFQYIENAISSLTKRWKKVYILFVSATPANYEKQVSSNTIVEQIIRPTWLLDPITYIYPKSWDYNLLENSFNKLNK
jgi:excinuclease ABC subunit B